jgi:HSP20 family protein
MTLIKWKNNANVMDRFIPVWNDLFNDFMNEDVLQKDFFKSMPAVNIMERENDFRIELAAPGLQKGDFKIEVEKNLMTISAEKKSEKKDENERFTRKEFSFSSFKRSFSLPEHVNAENTTAEYVDGVLQLTLPKKEEAKVKPAKEIKIS